jgi:DNA-binding beta-propeller fold protein YncE
MSPDGRHLYAVNTPDNRLEIFRVADGRIASVGSVTVGLEPVAVAARNDDEVWVVNHLSDSVSVVNVKKPKRAHVTRTLLVGDEPRDIVFAQDRAYVTTAHRGQNTGRNPQLTTPSVGRADVWVFNPSALGDTLAGVPVTVLSLFADTPRALAVSPDGTTVYAAAFRSGNRTTVVNERHVTNNGFAPPPSTNADGVPAPWGSLIVKYRESPLDGQLHWLDELNRPWDSIIRFSLPDKDVFAIDATLAVPAQKPGAGALAGVGTVLFNMAVNPVSGKVYVANLEALNDVRFEGHNAFGGGGSVRGHMAESRISVIDGADVTSRHLNKHIDFSQDGTPAEAEKSLAFPTGMDVSRDGKWLYVAALGSNKLGIFETSALESDEFVPSVDQQVALSGGGPTGVVLDEKNGVAYVMTRFDNGISVVNLKHRREVEHVKMYNPEPPSITNGRRFLYDATLTSSHGDSACASCHIFGDLDDLAWDLGNPDGSMLRNPGPFATPVIPPLMGSPDFHPMKGPTTTQSLRGMANHGPMHWRGDRTGGNDVPASAQPDTGTFDEQAAFKKFNQAFPGLLGRASELTDAEMQAFTDFILQVTYPPNPIRNLDNSLTPAQAAGRAFYFNSIGGQELPSDTFRNCNGCHTLDPNGNAAFGVARPGFFGSDGRSSFENEPQFMKIPHLRNLYQKVGMFGLADNFRLPIDNPAPRPPLVSFLPPPLNDPSFMGDQIRGFGFSHTGEVDTVFRFVGATVFAQRPETDPFPNPFGIPTSAQGIVLRRTLEAFLLAYDTNLAPIVGQQVTLTGDNHLVASARVDLLEQRAAAGDCELVVRARLGSCEVGFLYAPASGAFVRDRAGAAALSDDELRSLSSMAALTFTAVPRGSGARIALDRESDGVLDGDQNEDCDGF